MRSHDSTVNILMAQALSSQATHSHGFLFIFDLYFFHLRLNHTNQGGFFCHVHLQTQCLVHCTWTLLNNVAWKNPWMLPQFSFLLILLFIKRILASRPSMKCFHSFLLQKDLSSNHLLHQKEKGRHITNNRNIILAIFLHCD